MAESLSINPLSQRSNSAGLLQAARSQISVVALLLLLSGLAWYTTVNRMAGMDAGPGTQLGSLGWFATVWAVMMAAMMLPSLAPTTALYATLVARRKHRLWILFTGGYLLVWSATGLLVYGAFALGESLPVGVLAWSAGGRWLAGGVLAVAAIYQLTAAKRACLSRCREPQRLLMSSWREGHVGAACTGARTGLWCLGSSWALMAALFALGVMSVSWMVLMAVIVALEKLSTRPRLATITAATLLGALALAMLVSPHAIPMFTVPGAHGSMQPTQMTR